MDHQDGYTKSIHRLGRWGAAMALFIMVGIPFAICLAFDCFPPASLVLQIGAGLFMMFIPAALSEVISYAAILGSASYITFITGNVTNLKLPVAMNALKMAEVEQSTDLGDAIVTVAISASSIITMIVIALGVMLLVPLQPILTLPSVAIATKYIVPALLGGLVMGTFSGKSGRYDIRGKSLAVIPSLLLAITLILLGVPAGMYQGVIIVGTIPVTILTARILYRRRVIKIYEQGSHEPEDPETRK